MNINSVKRPLPKDSKIKRSYRYSSFPYPSNSLTTERIQRRSTRCHRPIHDGKTHPNLFLPIHPPSTLPTSQRRPHKNTNNIQSPAPRNPHRPKTGTISPGSSEPGAVTSETCEGHPAWHSGTTDPGAGL